MLALAKLAPCGLSVSCVGSVGARRILDAHKTERYLRVSLKILTH